MLVYHFSYKNVINWSSGQVSGKASCRNEWAWSLQPSRLDAKSHPGTPASILPHGETPSAAASNVYVGVVTPSQRGRTGFKSSR